MDTAEPTLSALAMADEMRDSWQGKALAHAKDGMAQIVLSVLAHNFDEAMPILLRVVFPGFTSIKAPFLTSAARVVKTGAVCADMVTADGHIIKNAALFRSETELRDHFRRLADDLKLDDRDRTEMFKCVQRWVVADYRLDPTMDPKDPDAKRLTVN